LVEEDCATSGLLATFLENSSYRVTCAGTGAEARSILGHLQPDLILLDLMLPDTDGLVLTSTLKKLTDRPIMILSARHEQVDRVLSLKLGAADVLAKPFDLDELEARTRGRSTWPTRPVSGGLLDRRETSPYSSSASQFTKSSKLVFAHSDP
jgi:DNA-binding response OmpR family regulator